MTNIDKNILAVTKLIQETQNGNVVWDSNRMDLTLNGDGKLIDLVYTTKFKGAYLRLYKYKYWHVPGTWDMNALGERAKERWLNHVKLEITDETFRNAKWDFPVLSSINDLYELVRYKTANVRVILDEMLGDLVIYEAQYGARDKHIDIAQPLSDMIVDNKLKVIVSNEIGGDPIPGIGKRLKLKYSYKEQTYEKEIPEGQELSIP